MLIRNSLFEPALFENFADLDRTLATFDNFRRRMETRAPEPRLSLEDKGDAFVLDAELPGVTPESLELTLTGPVLKLRARRNVLVPEGFVAHRRERPAFDLMRSITLPARVDAEKVTATAKDGIVTVLLPKAPESMPRNITVKTV